VGYAGKLWRSSWFGESARANTLAQSRATLSGSQRFEGRVVRSWIGSKSVGSRWFGSLLVSLRVS